MEPIEADLAGTLYALCAEHLRAPSEVTGYPGPTRTLVFDPPLSAEEETVYARMLRLARSRVLGISPAEWDALEPKIDEIRTLRTRTAQEWSAMTAAQRDNALIQWCQDLTDVLRAFLRD